MKHSGIMTAGVMILSALVSSAMVQSKKEAGPADALLMNTTGWMDGIGPRENRH
jgi:hypothetical protein